MRQRIARYRANTGPLGTVWNLGILAFLFYVVWRTGDPFVRAFMIGATLVCLALGWVIVPIARVNLRFASRLISIVNWAIIVAVVLNLSGIYSLPDLLWLVLLGTLVWVISASFWLASEPYVMTGYAAEKMRREHEREAIRRGEM